MLGKSIYCQIFNRIKKFPGYLEVLSPGIVSLFGKPQLTRPKGKASREQDILILVGSDD